MPPMTRRPSRALFGALAGGGVLLLVAVVALAPRPGAAADPSAPPGSSLSRSLEASGLPLPHAMTDAEFWQFVSSHSESSGSFPRENLTSNETLFERVIPDLTKRVKTGQVYLGVGPEQNFTYIAALKPSMAVIFDIRRGNLDVQLLYKAIFEMSADRADFVSTLFSRPRPAGLTARTSVADMFSAFARVAPSNEMYARNLKVIEDRLTATHKFAMTKADVEWVEYVFDTFRRYGYSVRPSPTYAELMTATDEAGSFRSYLADESSFAWLKDLETRNLVIPVVGDFAGPKAIREVGAYLKAHDATVGAFYLSNVEDYLYQDGKEQAFCANVATLPLDSSSTFIRSSSRGRAGFGGIGGFGGGFVSSLGQMAAEVQSCR
jgi:hypothetical protein